VELILFEEQAGKKRGVHKIIGISKKVIIHSFDKAMEVIRPGMEGYKAPGLAKVDGWDGSTGANALFKQKCLELFHGSQTEATKKANIQRERKRERRRYNTACCTAPKIDTANHLRYRTTSQHCTAQTLKQTGGRERWRGSQRRTESQQKRKECERERKSEQVTAFETRIQCSRYSHRRH
jgi:hypothetical protein